MKSCHIFRIGLFLLMAAVTVTTVPAATVQITGPTVISSPGTYVLTQDISTSKSPAIAIQSSNVVFDGNGHTIDGVDAGSSFGILVNANSGPLTGVTVKNVGLTDWYDGIYLKNVNGAQVKSITATSNVRAGISLRSANDNVISGCTSSGNGQGFYVWSQCSRNRIESCTMSGNADAGLWLASTGRTSSGIVYDSTGNQILGNTVTGNGRMGLYVDFSNGNTLRGNRVSNNPGKQIYLDYSSNVNIESNTVSSGGEQGIYLYDADGCSITGNTISGSRDNGLYVSSTSGLTITGNTISGNGVGGIVLNGEATIPANKNTVSSNTVRDNGQRGIFICRSSDNTITNNLFSNPVNVVFGGTCGPSTWSGQLQAGSSIVGGSSLGGNFWGTPSGTGFSEKTVDANRDGICDKSYVLNSANTDHLPLARPIVGVTTVTPVQTTTTTPPSTLPVVPTTQTTVPPIELPTSSPTEEITVILPPVTQNATFSPIPGAEGAPLDHDGDGLYEDVSGNGRMDFSDVTLFFNNIETVQNNYPVGIFDFNNNDRIDFSDVNELFYSL